MMKANQLHNKALLSQDCCKVDNMQYFLVVMLT